MFLLCRKSCQILFEEKLGMHNWSSGTKMMTVDQASWLQYTQITAGRQGCQPQRDLPHQQPHCNTTLSIALLVPLRYNLHQKFLRTSFSWDALEAWVRQAAWWTMSGYSMEFPSKYSSMLMMEGQRHSWTAAGLSSPYPTKSPVVSHQACMEHSQSQQHQRSFGAVQRCIQWHGPQRWLHHSKWLLGPSLWCGVNSSKLSVLKVIYQDSLLR
jgi:hypothetical protein